MTSPVSIERRGSKIELRCPYSPKDALRCKAVRPKGKWVPEDKCWQYPLDMRACRSLRQQFGDRLRVGQDLAVWAREQRTAEEGLAKLARSTTAKLVNVPRFAPVMADAMANRTYQQVGASFVARAGSCLVADQPGLGKTIQTLGGIIEAAGDDPVAVLVFCPLIAVNLVWAPEIAQWLGPKLAEVFPMSGTRAQRLAALEAANEAIERGEKHVFVIGNIEMARIKPVEGMDKNGAPKVIVDVANAEYPALFAPEWDALVVDESHKALIRTKVKPKGFQLSTESQTRLGMTKLSGRRKIALSGTPMRGKPNQLWGTLNWLRPDLFTAYWSWVENYYKLSSNGYSNYVLDGMLPGASERMAEDLVGIMLRRTKGEVLKELPPKTYAGYNLIADDSDSPHAVWLTMDPKQERQLKALQKDGVVSFGAGREMVANGHLAQRTRERQLADTALDAKLDGTVIPVLPSPKFDWIVEFCEENGIGPEGEGDARVVVASQFTSVLNLYAAELAKMGIACHLVTGETSERERQRQTRDFQSDSPTARVFLLNTKAGGVAITLDTADDLVLLDETDIVDDQEQVEDRIHRTSRMHNVTIHKLKMLGTIEEELAWVAAAQLDVLQYLLDGTRGVENARRIYAAKDAA